MSFYPRSGRRSGRGFMSQGWSQQPSSIFNMNPLDAIYNFMSPVLDIVSPLEDIKSLMNQGARMYGRTPPVLPKIVQQRLRKTTPSVKRGGQLLPQKYRIVIDCTDICDPSTLRTNIKCVQDNKHLIVTSNLKQGQRQFKRSYTLPPECETKKMTKFVTPQDQLVIEFNYMDVPLSLAISPEHEICTTAEHGKCVHIRVPIGDFVEPAKVKVHVKRRDLFVHFEERIVPCGDWCSRVIYHTRVQLPQNVNLNAITAKSDKHKLTILAPIGVKKGVDVPISNELKDIAVKRKLRHRKARAVSVGAEQKQQVPLVTDEKKKEKKKTQVQPSIGGEKQKKFPLETPAAKPTTPISGQKEPTISKKQQKKLSPADQLKSNILKPEEKLEPSISEKKPTLAEKKPVSEQLPGVTSEVKKTKKKKSKKLTATTTAMPTATSQEQRREPSPVGVGLRKSEERGEKERSPVRTTEKGSDILKNIFESRGESSQQQQQGRESSTPSTTQPSERVHEERQQVGGSMKL